MKKRWVASHAITGTVAAVFKHESAAYAYRDRMRRQGVLLSVTCVPYETSVHG